MGKKIKFAVVGCGHIGKPHAEMISRNEDCELVALIDIKKKEQLGIDHFDALFFNSLEAFLESPAAELVDVVNIATPNGYHAEQAMLCLEAKKHIVIEKPIALSKADAEKVIFKALQVHRQVFAVMQNRYSPPSIWLKKMLESGKLGNVFLVQINCYWNRDARYYKKGNWHGKKDLDGGTLFTQFSHFIDLMYWYFGDISNIQARFRDFSHQQLTDFEDTGIVNFDFLNGGVGSFNYSTAVWDKNLESSITIIAEHGSIKVGGQYMNEVEYCHVRDYVMPDLLPTNPGNNYGDYRGSAANHHFVIQNVVDVLNGKDTIDTNALEGLKVVDIIENIYKHKDGGE